MKIHHLRSATFVIESNQHFIVIDPMLGDKGTLPPFSMLRFKSQRNPTVDLPDNAAQVLSKVTQAIVTHSHTFGLKTFQHTDHLDDAGEKLLIGRAIPVATPYKDQAYLEKHGMTVSHGVKDWQTMEFLGGEITAVPAQHGHGWIHKMMANGSGFFIALPNEPTIYVSGDTVLTDDVKRALIELKPDITVVASGQAQMDVGQPLLMATDEVMEFIQLSPGKVIANHMEALNHCPVDRDTLRQSIEKYGLADKVLIPMDGETLEF
ncbi:MBL fold metallo-hydrolase [Vibrio brasiliensis]|uniref:MBL fold metallo-hydrolase n=1 Tax=Vibrio brasiliensis TaxID=170652 RepID=UPI001EFE8587|nr:MBL fold metallo-hydrolase [Vibrio brasiliensis]MCG9651078.1 MBL fold metallo-hydrolase [Vibrio brasiliensis]MCG9725008.1 MBL fold metallo-hydrolase [Vibrio brasiliensis]